MYKEFGYGQTTFINYQLLIFYDELTLRTKILEGILHL